MFWLGFVWQVSERKVFIFVFHVFVMPQKAIKEVGQVEKAKKGVRQVRQVGQDRQAEQAGRAEQIEQVEKIGHEELYDMLVSEEISWQAIIYDLIRSEQLNPLDLDIALLAQRYLEKVRQFEEANFFVSGKVLLAASILLRIKSERLFEQLLLLDELLFGRDEKQEVEKEKLFISSEDLPVILPKTPLARARRVTIEELMKALDKAVEVEGRKQARHAREIFARREAEIVLPIRTVNIHSKIKEIYEKIKEFFSSREKEKMTFSQLVGSARREDKIATFLPLLHLDSREKVLLYQEQHFGEINIYLRGKI